MSELYTKPNRTKRYNEEDFFNFIKQQGNWDNRTLLKLPNFEPEPDPLRMLNIIGSHIYPMLHGYIINPLASEVRQNLDQGWATLYMHISQNVGWDGSGYLILPQWGTSTPPIFGTFALCKHQNKYMASAKPSRGLHDQFCELCGLDTSVDSSD